MKQVRAVVLGAGLAGSSAAFAAQRALRRRDAVTVVSPTPVLQLRQTLVRTAFGLRKENAVFDVRAALEDKGISFKQASVLAISPEQNTVETTSGTMPYDYLFVGLGATWEKAKVPGSENAFFLGSLDSALAAQVALADFSGNDFCSVAAPGNKWEGPALETAFHAREYFDQRGRKEVKVKYVTAKQRPFEELGEKVSALVEAELERKEIILHAGEKAVQVTRDSVNTNKSSIPSDFTVLFPTYSGNAVVKESGLGDGEGFMPIDAFMRSQRHPNIFGAGDCVNSISLKIGFNALSGSSVAGGNIAAEILGKPLEKFSPKIVYVLETGGGEGVLVSAQYKEGKWVANAREGGLAYEKKLSFESTFLKESGIVHYVMGEKLG